MKKMTKKRALELAVLALDLEVSCRNLEVTEFDKALETLNKFYDIRKIRIDFSAAKITK